jgi:hypothetical protein
MSWIYAGVYQGATEWYNLKLQPIYSDHGRLDARSLAPHRLVARKLAANPALLDNALENLRRWQEAHGRSSPALGEWERVLTGTPDQVARFLVEQSERATRLRQSSPFAGILTEPERLAIYQEYSARAYHPGRERNLG